MLNELYQDFLKRPSVGTAIRLHRVICDYRNEHKNEVEQAQQCLDALKDYMCQQTLKHRTKYGDT